MSIIRQDRPNLSHTLCFLLSGKAGVGKTFTSQNIVSICDSMGLTVSAGSFASMVKSVATKMGWDGNKNDKGRHLLQGIGMLGREYSRDMWVKKLLEDLECEVRYPFDAVVIDDWRFINEYEYILREEKLYIPIKIRIESPNRELLRNTVYYNDISEIELDNYKFDCTVYNVGMSSDEYRLRMEDMVKVFLNKYTI